MSDRPVDYRKAKPAALQHLAAGGNQEARRELARRGLDASTAVDVTTLDYLELRRLVLGWRDGGLPEDRARSRDLAERAQLELEARYRADVALHDGRSPTPTPPPPAPWTVAALPRCQPWQRPKRSTLYPT